LGTVESDLRHDESALSLLQKSLSMFRQLGDLFFVARVSLTLGRLFLKQGKYDKAQLLFEDQLRIDKELQFWNGIAEGLGDLGNLSRYQEQYDQAAKYYEESVAVCREHGLNKYRVYYSSGLLALHNSNYALAFQCFIYPLNLAQKSGELVHVSMLLMGLAAVAAGTNQSERAAKLSSAAQAVFEAIDDQIPQFDRAEFDRHIQFARAQLGDDAVESLQAEGRAMTMEQAIAYALDDQE
jgi:tetratricopeptide (TPR) repeat protein